MYSLIQMEKEIKRQIPMEIMDSQMAKTEIKYLQMRIEMAEQLVNSLDEMECDGSIQIELENYIKATNMLFLMLQAIEKLQEKLKMVIQILTNGERTKLPLTFDIPVWEQKMEYKDKLEAIIKDCIPLDVKTYLLTLQMEEGQKTIKRVLDGEHPIIDNVMGGEEKLLNKWRYLQQFLYTKECRLIKKMNELTELNGGNKEIAHEQLVEMITTLSI